MVRAAIFLLLLAVLPSVAHAKRVALVVGINRYNNLPRDRQLRKAVNDALGAARVVAIVEEQESGHTATNDHCAYGQRGTARARCLLATLRQTGRFRSDCVDGARLNRHGATIVIKNLSTTPGVHDDCRTWASIH